MWLKEDPLKPPDWRWLRAWAIVKGSLKRRSGYDDEITGYAIKFGKVLARTLEVPTAADRFDNLALRFPDIFWAWRIYDCGLLYVSNNERNVSVSATRRMRLLRYELEARLLTKSTVAAIGKRMALSPELIDIYRYTFFDVSDNIENESYITHHAIGLHTEGDVSKPELDYGSFWKTIAYYGGEAALNSVTGAATSRNPMDDAANTPAFLRAQYENTLEQKALMAVRQLQPVGKQASQIMSHYSRMRESQREAAAALGVADGPGGGSGDITTFVSQALGIVADRSVIINRKNLANPNSGLDVACPDRDAVEMSPDTIARLDTLDYNELCRDAVFPASSETTTGGGSDEQSNRDGS